MGNPMNDYQWLPENSVSDSEIEVMSQKGAVKAFHIREHEVEDLYYVTVFYTWRAELLHLSTRRVKTEPKMWKSLDRLIAHIKVKFPKIKRFSVTLRDKDPTAYSLHPESEAPVRNTGELEPNPLLPAPVQETKPMANRRIVPDVLAVKRASRPKTPTQKAAIAERNAAKKAAEKRAAKAAAAREKRLASKKVTMKPGRKASKTLVEVSRRNKK